jgi:hypothetical protein
MLDQPGSKPTLQASPRTQEGTRQKGDAKVIDYLIRQHV